MTILANFTPDDIRFFHGGIAGTIPAYQEGSEAHIVDLDPAKANHVLNEFSKIGLVQMKFRDEPEQKKIEAIAQNKRFWEHQIEVFNQQNEQQREGGRAYNRPTELLQRKADWLGLELKKPWTVPKKDDAQITALKEENARLKAAMEDKDKTAEEQGKLIAQIMAKLNMNPESVESLSERIKQTRKRYISLTEKSLPGWVKNNWDEIHSDMPEENRFEIQTKYFEVCGVPFPTEQPS